MTPKESFAKACREAEELRIRCLDNFVSDEMKAAHRAMAVAFLKGIDLHCEECFGCRGEIVLFMCDCGLEDATA